MKPCLFLQCLPDMTPKIFADGPFSDRVAIVDQYALPEIDLSGYRALLLSMVTDQQTLMERKPQLEAFLDGGGTIVLNGHVGFPFLDGLTPFVPLPRRGKADLVIARLADHPVFDGVSAEDLTLRRGVAGFYGRGHNPPPAGALALNGVGPDRVPVDWLWHRPNGGRLFSHAGIDLWIYAGDPTGAARMTPNLIAWLSQTAEA